MMHKAWSSTGEVPYWFSRSTVKFKGHTGQKIADFDPNWAFPDCNSSLNSPMALKWNTKLNVVKKRCPIVFQGHPSNFKVQRDRKITNFDPNRALLDCNSSLTSLMDFKWCTNCHKAWCSIEEVPYCFPSNFKVTRDKISSISTRIEGFQTVTPVWIHWWIWNDAQSLM